MRQWAIAKAARLRKGVTRGSVEWQRIQEADAKIEACRQRVQKAQERARQAWELKDRVQAIVAAAKEAKRLEQRRLERQRRAEATKQVTGRIQGRSTMRQEEA